MKWLQSIILIRFHIIMHETLELITVFEFDGVQRGL